MTSSKVLFFLCISFIVGVFLSALGGPALGGEIPQTFVWGFLFVAVMLIFASLLEHGNRRFSYVDFLVTGFCLLFLIMGILRVQISEFNILNDKLSKLNGAGLVVLEGWVSSEPDVRDTSQIIKVKVGDSTVLVTTKRYPEYKYLDTVKITGKLETPIATDTFNYKDYLMKDHIYSVMGFPKIEVVPGGHKYTIVSYIYEKIIFVKQLLRISIQNNFLPPKSSILEGTILGNNGAMTSELKSKLNITGLRHIIAVSGTHVVILSALLMALLVTMGFWRGQAFYIAIVFVCIYIVLTGLPPSGIRAGIMGGICLLSQKIGRQSAISRLIVIAGATMLLINPLLLIYDIGFQLSFLAVVGLIYLEPLIKRFINFLTKSKAEKFAGILSTTFAAQVFTLPIMVYNFGNISFVAPITNLLIFPIVYWFMVLGFLVSVAGIFSNVLGWLLSVPCWFLLEYFLKVMDFFSQPWMAKSLENVSWVWVLSLYFVIGSGTWFLNKKYSRELI